MEEYKEENNKKRARDEFDDSVGVNSPESKLARVDSANANASKDSFNSGVRSPVVMGIQDQLLDIFDDSEPDPAIQGLDSVIRSFEEEILVPDPAPQAVMTSFSGESRPELGYLLEASDDELGLPPSFSSGGEEQKIETVGLEETGVYGPGPGPVTLDDIGLGFDELPNFDPYKFGMEPDNMVANDFITLGGGLFESEPGDSSEFLWRSGSLSAT